MKDAFSMRAKQRFVDTGKYLSAFADDVLVRCIQCEVAGIVVAQWSSYRWHAVFQCTGCSLELRSGDWVGPVKLEGRRPCGHCGHRWLALSVELPKPPTNPPATLPKQCPLCGHETAIPVSIAVARPGDHCIDPHFGLPLRLTKETRFGTVWAYNQRHVEELWGYISTKLRIRQNARNGAMFSRLPRWMKVAGHRDEIAKALSRLSADI